MPSFSLIDADLLSIGTDAYIGTMALYGPICSLTASSSSRIPRLAIKQSCGAARWSNLVPKWVQGAYLEAGSILSMGHHLRDGGLADGAPAETLKNQIAPKAPTRTHLKRPPISLPV